MKKYIYIYILGHPGQSSQTQFVESPSMLTTEDGKVVQGYLYLFAPKLLEGVLVILCAAQVVVRPLTTRRREGSGEGRRNIYIIFAF